MSIPYDVARQPILDDKGRTFGYEFLYRDDLENIFKCIGTEEDWLLGEF